MSLIKVCRYNKMIDCGERNCRHCGWNPDVKEIRLREWYAARAGQTKKK